MRLAVTESSRSRVGCWNTMPSRATRGHRVGGHVMTHHLDAAGNPGRTEPDSSWIRVVLPAPLGPSSAMNSPGLAAKLDAVDRLDRAISFDDVLQQQGGRCHRGGGTFVHRPRPLQARDHVLRRSTRSALLPLRHNRRRGPSRTPCATVFASEREPPNASAVSSAELAFTAPRRVDRPTSACHIIPEPANPRVRPRTVAR